MLYGAQGGHGLEGHKQSLNFARRRCCPRMTGLVSWDTGARLRQRTSTEGSLEMEGIEVSKNPASQPGIGHALK